MAGDTPLPPRFPCWCRATYSWGGETKKDLGFIEGDLIECLNAGDGAWWMGRLRRDPRMVGLFPSNFVQVLEESYRPPANSRNLSPTVSRKETPTKARSVFRKPFQAYDEIDGRGSLDSREATPESDKELVRKNKSKFKPYNSMKTAQAPTGTIRNRDGSPIKPEPSVVPTPPPRRRRQRQSRPSSPNPAVHALRNSMSASPTPTPTYAPPMRQESQLSYRTASPQPNYWLPAQGTYRAASPQPHMYDSTTAAASRSASPLPSSYHDGSPYPQLMPSREPSPVPHHVPYDHSRPTSPIPSFGFNERDDAISFPQHHELDVFDAAPPPPPAHRIVYQSSRAPSQELYGISQQVPSQTPAGHSPGGAGGMTPSPLRDAMNGVISSLQDMSLPQSDGPDLSRPMTPGGIVWSPDEFELVRRKSQLEHQRAKSSLGFSRPPDALYMRTDDDGQMSPPASRDGPPVLGTFIQRMEKQLRHQKSFSEGANGLSEDPPAPPLKGSQFAPRLPGRTASRPTTSSSQSSHEFGLDQHSGIRSQRQHPVLRPRKSAHELGRTQTTKTNATQSSSATQNSNSTNRSLMSGYSAGGFSATSAGSLARRRFDLGSHRSKRNPVRTWYDSQSVIDAFSTDRSMAASESSGSGPSYHASHASDIQVKHRFTPATSWTDLNSGPPSPEQQAIFGGLSAPKAKKSGFFKKMIESAKTTARTGAANARSTIGNASRPGSRSGSPTKVNSFTPDVSNSIVGFGGGTFGRPASATGSAAQDMGLGGDNSWMQSRRDVNRSNTISQRERDERHDRCEMLDLPALRPIDQLNDIIEGGEGLDGLPITDPSDFNSPNLALVDKSTRFITSLPPMVNATSLAQGYICRPHRSDVQRLRAIFTWIAERITWEDDFEGQPDSRRVISSKRGCSEEIAVLTREMCNAVGLHCEVVRGYLKSPSDVTDLDTLARPNHWWNAVIVDSEWRIMDCALASPSHPKRSNFSGASSQVAENWYFLARPTEICFTHVALLPEQQHLVPAVPHEVLCTLPCVGPTYFRNAIELSDFDTSGQHLENLEMAHFEVFVPEDVECIAEIEARAFAQDADGDFFESGEVVKKRALAQPQWIGGRKRYTIKALIPGDEGHGTLKVYAGKRGLMHSIKDIPHSLAIGLPLSHTGQNPPYDFFRRHPTPHAQRHDLYVAQPQCLKLVPNMTYVFCIRQHPSSLGRFTPDTWGSNNGAPGSSRPSSPTSNVPFARPSSAMSMISTSTSHQSSFSSDSNKDPMTAAQLKPVKLAIQTPSQKIIRLTRKQELAGRVVPGDIGITTEWETVIKVSERGTWRGLVLADRSARWCVFSEWECV